MTPIKKVLLVSPGDGAAEAKAKCTRFDGYASELLKVRSFMVPLHIATIAALTPDGIDVEIWDEAVQGPVDDADRNDDDLSLVGVTGYSNHHQRALQISRYFRKRGIPVVVGGAGVSACPEAYRNDFDVLFLGESEETWPRFIRDFAAGTHHAEYRSTTHPDMALSPKPRWDSIAATLREGRYLTGGVQTSRGCPYSCNFCVIWKVYGRKTRLKPAEQVVEEIINLERLGIDYFLFCSDNFLGNRVHAREILRHLVTLNRSLPRPVGFSAELDLGVARDDDLLALFADAGFMGFLIGIESVNQASLQEAGKQQNVQRNIVEACRKAQSYGIPVDASMIVGFDTDTTDTFDEQFSFIEEACIPVPRMHMLKAVRGTELWDRLAAAGRIVASEDRGDQSFLVNPQHQTNIVPKQMSRVELMVGYRGLLERLGRWESFERRMLGFLAGVEREPHLPVGDLSQGLPALLDSFLATMCPDAQDTVERIRAYARAHTPYLMRTVALLIYRFCLETLSLPHKLKSLDRQIALERSPGSRISIFSSSQECGAETVSNAS